MVTVNDFLAIGQWIEGSDTYYLQPFNPTVTLDESFHVLQRYPYLVALSGGEIVAYAYVSPFKERAAYDWAVETSIYVKQDHKRMGIGSRMYRALEDILKIQGILNMSFPLFPSATDRDNAMRPCLLPVLFVLFPHRRNTPKRSV